MRVLYSAVGPGTTVQIPSGPALVPSAGSYEPATPSRKNSSTTHPSRSVTLRGGAAKGQPLPPVTRPVGQAAFCCVMIPLVLLRVQAGRRRHVAPTRLSCDGALRAQARTTGVIPWTRSGG